MAVTADIMESWRHPRRVLRRHLARPRSEAFAFTFLFTFLLVAYIAQWPVASRASFLQPEVPMFQRMLAAGMGLLATIPLWYGLAALSRLVAGVLGGQGSWFSARLALFWALVVISPLLLLQGLALAFLGMGAQTTVLGAGVAIAFLALWMTMLSEAERG